jgi:hypothetical protein
VGRISAAVFFNWLIGQGIFEKLLRIKKSLILARKNSEKLYA